MVGNELSFLSDCLRLFCKAFFKNSFGKVTPKRCYACGITGLKSLCHLIALLLLGV